MRSLQFKLTMTMLLTSLASVALVGIIARGSLNQRFDQISMDQSLQSFRSELEAYLSVYGTWEKGQQSLPFNEFVRRRNEQSQNLLPQSFSHASESLFQFRQAQMRPQGEPPQSGPPQGDDPDAAFRFMVLDPTGRVLLGPPEMRNRFAPADLRAEAEPVKVNGQTAALVVPYGDPVYTSKDIQYLTAVRDALFRGMLCAALLALVLGLYFGNSLSRKLHELSMAIEAMSEGDLRQQVHVNSDDEIGVLAMNFNRMSADLAQAHEELQQSHDKISQQAVLLKELSVRDGLTKLYNRRFFDERGKQLFVQAKRYDRPFTIMIGDIDFFKKINDNYSHATGDEVLRRVSALLQKSTRDSDMVARYGGEEFVIAFPETPLKHAAALCERLRQQIETHPWQEVDPTLHVTMSMGLTNDLSLETFERMVDAADGLLYQAKEAGRNRICLPPAD
jgi:two-component system cell cycle response regulator